jgi:hypothetical protein
MAANETVHAMTDPDDCGCCDGVAAVTPASKENRQGLAGIAYRVGTHASFRQSLLARLSSTDYPALAGLTTRHDDDWTIGLCDAFAVMGDVVTFYQERIANEAWLRTAVERGSVLELSRLVGYQLAPGVAASTSLAFTLDAPLTQPAPPPLPVTIPPGARVQSVPGPDESAQTFETVAPIVARVEWNEMRVQTRVHELPYAGQQEIWLQGTATLLQPGDPLLLVGAAREHDPNSTAWNLRFVETVEPDDKRGCTRVSWSDGLTVFSPPGAANNTDGVRVYALRQRAALFGHNAPDPNLVIPANMPSAQKVVLVTADSSGVLSWNRYGVDHIDLDAVYPKIVRDGWMTLVDEPSVTLHGVDGARQVSLASFGLSGKVTRVTPDTTTGMSGFDRRNTSVYAQDEELAPADRPLFQPLFGVQVPLGSLQPLLQPGQAIALSGKRHRVAAPDEPTGISFPDDATRTALPGESFIVTAPPLQILGSDAVAITPEDLDPISGFTGLLRWMLLDRDGAAVTIEADAGVMRLQATRPDDPVVSEIARIDDAADAISHDRDRSVLRLAAALANCYERDSLRINANVAPATHGETVAEVAGSGNASAANQRFVLKQSPLTYVPARNPQGREAALKVYVNELLWREERTLFAQPPRARVYALRQGDDGATTLQFGDGVKGARLPSGANNVRASYRKGLGLSGNVRAGTLTTPLLQPVGVKGATNPVAASGGEDPEPLAAARRNVPITVLTLDRAVSVLDYANFARAFAGIDKASALWIPGGPARGVHITVAGAGGKAVPPGSDPYDALLRALRAYGDALLPLTLRSFLPGGFRLRARIKVAADAQPDKVLAEVGAALHGAFGYDARDFGQAVTIDAVIATIHRVAGAMAVDIDRLFRSGTVPGPQPEPRIFSTPATIQPDGTVSGAQLLTLDADGVELSEMP